MSHPNYVYSKAILVLWVCHANFLCHHYIHCSVAPTCTLTRSRVSTRHHGEGQEYLICGIVSEWNGLGLIFTMKWLPGMKHKFCAWTWHYVCYCQEKNREKQATVFCKYVGWNKRMEKRGDKLNCKQKTTEYWLKEEDNHDSPATDLPHDFLQRITDISRSPELSFQNDLICVTLLSKSSMIQRENYICKQFLKWILPCILLPLDDIYLDPFLKSWCLLFLLQGASNSYWPMGKTVLAGVPTSLQYHLSWLDKEWNTAVNIQQGDSLQFE